MTANAIRGAGVSPHGGRRPGAGRPRTTGTGRALRLSEVLLARVSQLGAGEAPQAQIASMCDQLEHVRRVLAGHAEPVAAMDALRAMLRAVEIEPVTPA